MPEILKIEGGRVYDPRNGTDGEVVDLWLRDGKVAGPPESETAFRKIDASGRVVMPGGIDMHCHIAGPKVNHARLFQPEDHRQDPVSRTDITRSGTGGSVPSSFVTGYRYSGLGYTTAFDAAITPLSALQVHYEFGDIPCIDKGFFALVGNNHFVLEALKHGEPERVDAFLGWLMNAAGAYAPKIVNPGGVESWKQNRKGNFKDLDESIDHFDVSPRQIIHSVAESGNRLNLPHPVHIHCNNLGMPGNWSTTLETMKCLAGMRGHLTHIQFHSYGGGEEDETSLCSKVDPLAEFVNANPNLTVDVGQVMFGRTTSMTGDSPLGHYLQQLSGEKWISIDTELESGCGISPIEFRNRNFVHALQWAIGLEWYLKVADPWQIGMSTDHPNGGSFLAYPQIIRLLMDASYRRDCLAEAPRQLQEACDLASLTREYSLQEIAIITRAAPAKMLGLKNKGHLGFGADADLAIYTPNDNRQTMFELPWMVIKGGEVVFEEGEIRKPVPGRTIYSAPRYDQEYAEEIRDWFHRHYSLQIRSYGAGERFLNAAIRNQPGEN